MIIRICYLTQSGKELAQRLISVFEETIFEVRSSEEPLDFWVACSFQRRLPILFIGACGIAVRSIAPYVQDKLWDSPVLVMDEKGQYVIPLLSGHLGGANALAGQIAGRMHARSVITTATDLEGVFAVDVFAARNGYRILHRDGIRKISGMLLRGEQVTVAIDPGIAVLDPMLPERMELVPFETEQVNLRISALEEVREGDDLLLVAKPYVAGMGCKKGKSFRELYAFFECNCPAEMRKGLYGIASIDLKKKEAGLVELAQYEKVPFMTFTAAQLEGVAGEYAESEFVKQVTGVSNVCERAAMCGASEGAQMVLPKMSGDGMTLAIAKRLPVIQSWITSGHSELGERI